MTALSGLEWKGNIREISNLAQQICLSENRKELIDSFIHAHCTPLHTPKSQSILRPISNAAASGKQPADPKDPAHLLQGDLIPLKEALRPNLRLLIYNGLWTRPERLRKQQMSLVSVSVLFAGKKQSLAYPKIQVPAKKLPAMPFKNLKGMTGFFDDRTAYYSPTSSFITSSTFSNFFCPVSIAATEKKGIIFIPFRCIYQCLCNAVRNSPDIAVFQTLEAAFDSRADSLFDLLQKWI